MKPTSIAKIPDDVLHEVFSILTSRRPDNVAIIASTCRRWRNLALTRSRYWNRLVLDRSKSKNLVELRDKAALWFSRCIVGQLETTLVYSSRPYDLIPLLSCITFPQRRITFRGDDPRLFILCVDTDTQSMHPDTLQVVPWVPVETPPKSFTWDLKQRLSILLFGQVLQRCMFTTLDSPPRTPFGYIRTLQLLEPPFSQVTGCREAVEFLSAFPSLVSLTFGGTRSGGLPSRTPRDCLSIGSIPLPALRSIDVKQCPYFNCLVTHLQIPKLKKLAVMERCALDKPSPRGSLLSLKSIQSPGYPWPTSIRILHLIQPEIQHADYVWIFKNLRRVFELKLKRTTNKVLSLLRPTEDWDPLPVLTHLDVILSPVTGSTLISLATSRRSSSSVSGIKILKIAYCSVSKDECVELGQLVDDLSIVPVVPFH